MKRIIGIILLFVIWVFISCSDNGNYSAIENGDKNIAEKVVGIWGRIDQFGDEWYWVFNADRTGYRIFKHEWVGTATFVNLSQWFVDGNNLCVNQGNDISCFSVSFLFDGRLVLQGSVFDRINELPEHIRNALENK